MAAAAGGGVGGGSEDALHDRATAAKATILGPALALRNDGTSLAYHGAAGQGQRGRWRRGGGRRSGRGRGPRSLDVTSSYWAISTAAVTRGLMAAANASPPGAWRWRSLAAASSARLMAR